MFPGFEADRAHSLPVFVAPSYLGERQGAWSGDRLERSGGGATHVDIGLGIGGARRRHPAAKLSPQISTRFSAPAAGRR